MKQFIALVHKDADSAWGVEFPDCPGCFSAADRMEDIIPNAIEALQLWGEDQEFPDPSDMDAVRAASAEQLAQGAFLVMVPYIEDDTRTVRANISFEKGILSAIDAAASERRLTRSAFLADAAKKVIEGRV